MAVKQRVAVIPFPFASHPISLLNIVVRLARSSPETLFSFLTTPRLIAPLFKPSLPANIKPYPIADGLPPGYTSAAATWQLNIDLRQIQLFVGGLNLRNALDAAESGEGIKVTSLVVDLFLSVYASEVGLPWIPVWSPSPLSLSTAIHAELLRRGVSGAAEFVPGLPPGLQSRVHDTWPSYIVLADSTVSPFREAIRGLERVLPLASAVVLNSFVELYPAVVFLDLEAKLSTASVLNVGFHTVSLPMITTTAKSDTAESDSVMTWLDGQEPNSVVYVSFGTVIGFSNEELWAIAEALEEKGKAFPFLWSLPDRQKRALPDGFVERTSRFGKVVAWAHQLRVLGHVSVGVHVSHCGCNSVNESIAIGVPMIARPVWADNHVNAKMVESVWKIGVGLENGVFTKNGFVEALELVLEREEGKKMRERALALKKLVFDSSAPNGSATRDFNSLLDLVRG